MIWPPFSPLKSHKIRHKVLRGDGVWLYLDNGRKVIDGFSSWWVNLHGHANPEIADAISRQAHKLEHAIFANFTHEAAEKAAESICSILPDALDTVFFSDNGSTAVEVALKMIIQYWKNIGEPNRTEFLMFDGAYHGDTFGAMSVGSKGIFNEPFQDLMFPASTLPFPSTWLGDGDVDDREKEALNKLGNVINEKGRSVAGLIIEPLVQGAGGMNMCRPQFLDQVMDMCRAHNVPVIFDEVMTGFGRTGDYFACNYLENSPDVICLSKGLTGGFLPMSVTVCTRQVRSAFESDLPSKTFYHGHSYTANPLGCAAAIASIDLLRRRINYVREYEKGYTDTIVELEQRDFVKRIRVKGSILAFDIDNGHESGYLNKVSKQIRDACVDYEILLRPLGQAVYLMPPLSISVEERKYLENQTLKLLDDLFA